MLSQPNTRSPKKHLIFEPKEVRDIRKSRKKNISQTQLSHAQNKEEEQPKRHGQQQLFAHKY